MSALALLAALAGLSRVPEAALLDHRWAERRSHIGAALAIDAQAVPTGAPAVPLRPNGPIYRLPVSGRLMTVGGELVIMARPGAPALAPASGRVAYAGRYRRYGGVLILDHGHGWTTVLTGLAGITVPQGIALKGGDLVGRASGRVRVRLIRHGRIVDPAAMAAQG